MRATLESILPGVIPASAASVGMFIVGAPAWLQAIGQALIVAMWCSSAVKRQNRETLTRLRTIEDAVQALECVKRKRVEALIGTPLGISCPTPPPSILKE